MSGPKHNDRSAPSMCLRNMPAALVDLLVDEVLDRRSVALVPPHDGIEEPEVLRRVDGSSVYTVAGADLYTSQRILDAEQRLVSTAGRRDGSAVDARRWIWRCWRWRRTAPPSMRGRRHWSARCAPRGSFAARDRPGRRRKDDRHACPRPGLDPRRRPGARPRPSAAAAAVLGEQTGIRTDTLAKLTWSLAARRPAGLGGRDRPVDTGDHRRSRNGRHPLPRHRRPVRHRSRCERAAGR